MRKFNITVNGLAYEVEVEEIGGAPVYAAAPTAAPVYAAPVAAPAPVAAAPAPAAAPAAAPKAAAPAAAPKAAAPAAAGADGKETVNAPMPGTILDVKVSVGQAVKKGDVLVVLEAMKMENEIMAANDGTVASVKVTKGATVNSGDVLLTLN